MIALNVLDIKPFMKHFLVGNTFDAFDLSEGSVTTFCTFSIDGTYMKDFDDSDGENEDPGHACIPWARIREHVFSLMRGKRTPLAFKFVFMLPKKAVPRFLEKAGIAHECGEQVEIIVNRQGTDMCPMEQSVAEITDPREALTALKAKIAQMQAMMKK